ncbi:putative glycine-rich protein 2 at N-terminal half [Balamuthia mandrillaris]
MNPKCGFCNKTVYPVEAIKGANKTYHKGCFRCVTCKTTLNLKNFKAYEGSLYCGVHYPPSVTKVADFGNDRKADSGEYASDAAASQTDAGGAWGSSTPDSGEYGGAAAGGGYDQGGYDQGGYDQGGYDQGGYQEGY